MRVAPPEEHAPSARPGRVSEVADLILIDRVAEGDVAAFNALFRRYGPRLRRFLGRLTRRHHLIDEVLNDTMLAIWLKAGTFDMRSKVSTWVFGIALRRGLKAVERSTRLTALDLEETQTSSPGPEEHASRKELRARLDRALKALSPEHRAVVELSYFEGHSYREIASMVGCPADTVKTRMFHARRRLRALLADQREDAA